MPDLAEQAKAVKEGRESIHGNFSDGHTRLGRTWAALLSEYLQTDVADLPPHIVELMLVALKLHRACRPFGRNEDDYVDGLNYLGFAAHDSRRLTHGQPDSSRRPSAADSVVSKP